MQERQDKWRQKLMGTPKEIKYKRKIYSKYIQGHTKLDDSILQTIRADIPRTFAASQTTNAETVSELLVEYAIIQNGDSYLQGFSYFMTVVHHVFHDSSYRRADIFYCFANLIGLIRPLMPDFNAKWFTWNRNYWISDLLHKLQARRPLLASILNQEMEVFSSMLILKWYFLWFAQNIVFSEILELWDFLLTRPKETLMHTYNCIAYEIINQAADDILYQNNGEPIPIIYKILDLKISNIPNLIQLVRKNA